MKYVPVLVNVQGYLWNESEAGFPQHLSAGRHTRWPCQSSASLTLQRDRAQHTYHHEQRQHAPKGGSRAREEGAEPASSRSFSVAGQVITANSCRRAGSDVSSCGWQHLSLAEIAKGNVLKCTAHEQGTGKGFSVSAPCPPPCSSTTRKDDRLALLPFHTHNYRNTTLKVLWDARKVVVCSGSALAWFGTVSSTDKAAYV